MTPTECCVCSSPMLAITLSMVECGASAEEIANTTGVELPAIQEHLENCCVEVQESPAGTEPEQSDQRLRIWPERSNQSWHSCTLVGDTRGAQAALQSGIKAELALRAKAGLGQTAPAEPEDGPCNTPLTVNQLDELVRKLQVEKYELCPACHSWGDRGRIQALHQWMAEKELAAEFNKWLNETASLPGSSPSGAWH
jgi:hypothetical protein